MVEEENGKLVNDVKCEMLMVILFCTSAPQVLMIQSYQNQPRCMGPEDGRNVWAYIFLGIHIFRYTHVWVCIYLGVHMFRCIYI